MEIKESNTKMTAQKPGALRSHDPRVGGRSRQGTVAYDMLIEDAGAVEGAFEVGSILKFAHLLYINPGAIWEHLD